MSGDLELQFSKSQTYRVNDSPPPAKGMLGPRSPVIVGIIILSVVGIVCTGAVLYLVLQTGEDIKVLQTEIIALKQERATFAEALQNDGMPVLKASTNPGYRPSRRNNGTRGSDSVQSIVITLENVTSRLDDLVDHSKDIYKILSVADVPIETDDANATDNARAMEKETTALRKEFVKATKWSDDAFENVKSDILMFTEGIRQNTNRTTSASSMNSTSEIETLLDKINRFSNEFQKAQERQNDTFENLFDMIEKVIGQSTSTGSKFSHSAVSNPNRKRKTNPSNDMSTETLNLLKSLKESLLDPRDGKLSVIQTEQETTTKSLGRVASDLHKVVEKLGDTTDQVHATNIEYRLSEIENGTAKINAILQDVKDDISESIEPIRSGMKNISVVMHRNTIASRRTNAAIQGLRINTSVALNGLDDALNQMFSSLSETLINVTDSSAIVTELQQAMHTLEEKIDTINDNVVGMIGMQDTSSTTNHSTVTLKHRSDTMITMADIGRGIDWLSEEINKTSGRIIDGVMNEGRKMSDKQSNQLNLASELNTTMYSHQTNLIQLVEKVENYQSLMSDISNRRMAQDNALRENVTKEVVAVQNKVDDIVGILVHHDGDILQNIRQGFNGIGLNISKLLTLEEKNTKVVAMLNGTGKRLILIDDSVRELTSQIDTMKANLNDSFENVAVTLASELELHSQDIRMALAEMNPKTQNQTALANTSTLDSLNTKLDDITAKASRILTAVSRTTGRSVPTTATTALPTVVTRGNARLVNVSRPAGQIQGRLEVLKNNVWGTVCDDSFGVEDATVACVMLGYSRGLFDCTGISNHNCGHSEDVGVICS